MKKALLIILMLHTAIVVGESAYKNEIGLVFGVPDMINIKYQRYFNNMYVGLNSGLNPDKTIAIPALYVGYNIITSDNLAISVEMVNAYWPKMAELSDPYTVNNQYYYETDWLHTAIRPLVHYNFNKIRIAAGFGIDCIAEITREPSKTKYKQMRYFPSLLASGSYIF